jgi:hypothetical protein
MTTKTYSNMSESDLIVAARKALREAARDRRGVDYLLIAGPFIRVDKAIGRLRSALASRRQLARKLEKADRARRAA